MSKRTFRILAVIGIIGSVLLLASFVLPQVRVTILDRGYSASGYDLVEGKMIDDYRSGVGINFHVGLPPGFPSFSMYYLLVLFGFLTLPISVVKDKPIRALGILFGILAMAGAMYGYSRFADAAASEPGWTVDFAYGLVVTVLAASLIFISNTVYILLKIIKPKPAVSEDQ